jgi:hypothetical protein
MTPDRTIICAVHYTSPHGLEHVYEFHQTRGLTGLQQATVQA